MASITAPAAHFHVHEAFIDDNFVLQCSRAQRRQFLKTGIVPKIGQRVELTVLLEELVCRLSGEVVVVQPSPQWSVVGENTRAVSSVSYWRPSSSPGDYGPSRGSSVLAYILMKKLPRERARRDGSIPSLADIWDQVVAPASKEEMRMMVIQKFGALHGQQVVVEGRLNFDYDLRRGSEDGPWRDNIPFDGRDVWRFVLSADDSMANIWRADPESFANLGRNHRDRCWPWSQGNALPYGRSGRDEPFRGSPQVHVCKGPFGCNGTDHPHSFPAIAA